MNTRNCSSVLTLALLGLAWLFSAESTQAQSFPTWNGSSANWSNTGNWTGGNASNYGQLQFTGSGQSATNNDISGLSQWRFYFSGSNGYTLSGNSVNLFDFGGANSWILSDSTATQTFSTLDVNFAATAGATFGQISARNTGDLVLNNIGITGSQVSQLRVAGESTGKVVFNGAISGSGKQVVIGLKENAAAATTTDVYYNATNTYSGDTFVVAGSLSFGSGGSASSSILRLGETSGSNSATIKLASTSGGQTISSVLNPRAGSSGTLTLASQNSSGTNTYSGHIGLDHNLSITQAGGGTLAISSTHTVGDVSNTLGTDIKGNALTLTPSSSGTINYTGNIYNSTGSGSVTLNGSGTTILAGANTYTGATTLSAGKLLVNGSTTSATTVQSSATLGGSGTLTGTVLVQSGAHLAPGNSIGTLSTGALTLNSGSFTDIELGTPGSSHGSPGSSDRTNVSGSLTLGGTLNLVDNAGANGNGSAGAGSYLIFTQTGTATGSFSSVVDPSASLHAKVDSSTSGSVFVDVYRVATANTISSTVDLGRVHMGGTFTSQGLSIQNTASSDGFSEGLDASGGSLTGDATTSGSITNLAGGSTSTAVQVGLSNTATFGTKTGTVTVNLASNGTNSAHSNTTLSSQTINVTGFVYSGTGVWGTSSSGTWNSTSNWQTNGGVPGLDAGFTNTDSATFGGFTSGTPTVTLDGVSPSIKALVFSSAARSYTLAQGTGGTIKMNTATSPAIISSLLGSHLITAPIQLQSNTDVNVASGSSLTISGTISDNGARLLSMNAASSGTLTLSGANTYNGNTLIHAGTLNVTNTTGSGTGTGSVEIEIGATLSGNGKIDAGDNYIIISGAIVVGDSTLGAPVASQLEFKTNTGIGTTIIGDNSTLFIDLFANAGNNTSNASAADMLRLFGDVSVESLASINLNDATGTMTFNTGDIWKIADVASATVTGAFFAANITGPALGVGQSWAFTSDSNSWFLSVVATVPEPSRAMLLLLGMSGLFLRRRRA